MLDSEFTGRLRALLAEHRTEAASLWIEVAEPAAVHHFGLLRELAALLRSKGVKLGLEHAGEHVAGGAFALGAGDVGGLELCVRIA